MSRIQKGMVDLLAMLGDGAKSFSELKKLNLSPSTLLKRIREAQQRGMVKEKLDPRGRKKPTIKYELTDQGKKTLKQFESIIDRYQELKLELDDLVRKQREKEKEIEYLLLQHGNESDNVSR
ncbi:MAG: winged helix-turn-helix transcriptional regulator [Promethearchaeati archaeon SRVP18_Atabeyarchaeia-1]